MLAFYDIVRWMIKWQQLSAKDAQEYARRAAAMLAKDPRVQLVYLFGSAADRSQRTARDVDVALLTDPPLPAEELLRLRADLVHHTGADMDLVALNDASVVLAHEVVENGVCLFTRDASVEADFVVRARARYWDFKPFLEDQWRLAGERLKEREDGS